MTDSRGKGCVAMACVFWIAVFGVMAAGLAARHWHFSLLPEREGMLALAPLIVYAYIWRVCDAKYWRRCGIAFILCGFAVMLQVAARRTGNEALESIGWGSRWILIFVVWPAIREYALRQYVANQAAEMREESNPESPASTGEST